jgi:hypothetical protein
MVVDPAMAGADPTEATVTHHVMATEMALMALLMALPMALQMVLQMVLLEVTPAGGGGGGRRASDNWAPRAGGSVMHTRLFLISL